MANSFLPQQLWKSHRKGWAVVLTILMASTALVKENSTNLQISLLTIPEHAPFDGTVYPIQQVPDWVNATALEREMSFNDFPVSKRVDIPSYDPSRLSIDATTLDWGNVYDNQTRVGQVTYSVPYAGSYKLDGRENVGSHPGVDIKALAGTPVYSIMNGVVEKVSYSNGGFGNLIVVRHDDVPALENSLQKTTLHAGYAHLKDIFVTDGEVVRKGQMIGTVGMTGTATTNHLHFQIDRHEAPWHLYWPFTSAEANQVGGFWAAINTGLNQQKIFENTINPMKYVQKYLDAAAAVDTEPEVDLTETTIEVPVVEPEVVEPETVTPPVVSTPVAASGELFHSMELSFPPYAFLNETYSLTLSLVDERGEPVRGLSLNSPVKIEVSDGAVVQIFPSEFSGTALSTGQAEVSLSALKPGAVTVSASFLGKTYVSSELTISAERTFLNSLALETDKAFSLGRAETVVVVALNADGQRLPSFVLNEPVRLEVVQGQGSLSRTLLMQDDFKDGLATVEFTPGSDEDVILKVSANSVEGASALLTASLFKDIDEENPYYQAIAYLRAQGVVSGYEDETFRPDQAVSRVEALKLLFAGFNKELATGATLAFPDTDSGAWYAPYVAAAQRDGVARGYPDGSFRPANPVNRVEFIKMLAGAVGMDVDPVVVGNPYEDVHYLEWFAPYAQFVKITNVGPWLSEKLEPSKPMTRGEVAEMIYRLLAMQKSGAEVYSRTLVLE